MTPKVLLELWRDRWAKPTISSEKVPYIDGRISQWGLDISKYLTWGFPSIIIGILFFVLFISFAAVPVIFSITGQIVFSMTLAIFYLIIRPNAGVLPTLILISISLITSLRYLFWRFSETIGNESENITYIRIVFYIAELYLCCLAALSFIELRWPIKRNQSNLRNDTSTWPTIDVFILCHNKDLNQIDSIVQSLQNFIWPHKKLKAYLFDKDIRPEISDYSRSKSIEYFCNVDGKVADLGSITTGDNKLKGDFVLLLDNDCKINYAILKNTVGWFLRNQKIGMLVTANHISSNKISRRIKKLFVDCDNEASLVLLRQSIFSKYVIENSILDRKKLIGAAEENGYNIAYLGIKNSSKLKKDNDEIIKKEDKEYIPTYFCVDLSVINSLMYPIRDALSNFYNGMEFYRKIPWFILLLGPLPYLFFSIKIIHSNVDIFLGYGIPHLFFWYMAKDRIIEKKRLLIFVEIKEALLGIYIYFLTAFTFIKTFAYQIRVRKLSECFENVSPGYFVTLTLYGALISLNVYGVGLKLLSLPLDNINELYHLEFYIFVALVNVVIMCSLLAVAEEVRYIKNHVEKQIIRRAIISLPLGRSLACLTSNFPDAILTLKLPEPVNLSNVKSVYLTLYKNEKEYVFVANIKGYSDDSLELVIDDSSLEDYVAFKDSVYSRDQNWPKWFPDRNSDKIAQKIINIITQQLSKFYLKFKSKFNKKVFVQDKA